MAKMLDNKNSWPEVHLTSADENAKRIYEKDWSQHSMGPIENWSPSFITTLTTAIGSQCPALMSIMCSRSDSSGHHKHWQQPCVDMVLVETRLFFSMTRKKNHLAE